MTRVGEAKKALEDVKQKADIEAFRSDGDEEINQEQVARQGTEQPDAVTDEVVPPNLSSPSNQGSGSESGDLQPGLTNTVNVAPSIRRVSTPRRNRRSEDMSIDDFFRFTMMQREQDRRDREEREMQLMAARENEDRMFRQMFLAVLMRGKDTRQNPEEDLSIHDV